MEATIPTAARKSFLSRLEDRNTLIAVTAITLLATYAVLFYAKAHVRHGMILFAVGNTVLRMTLDMAIVAFGFSLYLAKKARGRSIFPLMAAFSFAALIQMVYGTCVQVLGLEHFSRGGEVAILVLHLAFLLGAIRFLSVAKAGRAISPEGWRWIVTGIGVLIATTFVVIGRELFASVTGALYIHPVGALAQFLVLVGFSETPFTGTKPLR